MKVVFTAHSSRNSHHSMMICKYVFEKGHIPVNLFNLYGYFLYGLVGKDKIFRANNEILKKCDELWVFGEITEGVQIEIDLAKRENIPVKYFKLIRNGAESITISEISEKEIEYDNIPDTEYPRHDIHEF